MKKKDVILAACILAIALGGLLFMKTRDHQKGSALNVMVDGELYASYSLEEDRTIRLSLDGGENTFRIENGSVRMLSADCPDQYCVEHAAISADHETIVCLPHRLVLEIRGGEEKDVDA